MKSEYNKTSDLRLGYLKDIDSVLSNIFQDGISENSFKQALDNDINKTIQYFGEKNLLVGKITLRPNYKKDNLGKDYKDESKNENIITQAVPLFLSEKAFKYLNKSFMC